MLLCSLVCVGAVSIFIILNRLYKKTNAYKNLQLPLKRYEQIEDGLEIVNVGSGPSYHAFDYQNVWIKGFNFANAPQSAYHDYALLNHYKRKIEKNAIVIVAITCPLSFCKNKFHDNKNYRCKYYNVLDAEEVDGGRRGEAFLYQYFPLLLYPKRIVRIFRDVPQASIYAEQSVSLRKDAEKMMRGWSINNGVQDLKDETQAMFHQEEFDKKIEIYKKILQLCQEREWRAYFVILPVSVPIREMMSMEFKQKFVLDNIQKANIVNVPVLDYSNDERMADDRYYLNSMFLNETGRKKFWRIMGEDLKLYN